MLLNLYTNLKYCISFGVQNKLIFLFQQPTKDGAESVLLVIYLASFDVVSCQYIIHGHHAHEFLFKIKTLLELLVYDILGGEVCGAIILLIDRTLQTFFSFFFYSYRKRFFGTIVVKSPFQLQITASIRERLLQATWDTIAAAVCEPRLLFVAERVFSP